MWAVSLSGDVQFGGGPRGFVRNPQSKGTYFVAFFSNDNGKATLEHAVGGELVLN